MTSMLTKLGNICGSYVQVHAMFECPFAIPANLWDGSLVSSTVEALSKQSSVQQYLATVHNKKSKKSCNGQYQYISMEYCSGGDVETYLRSQSTNWVITKSTQTTGLPQAKELLSWLFQMAYSLYVGRDFLELIHYDIKLLNFFITSGDSLGTVSHQKSLLNTDNGMIIGLGNTLFRLPIEGNMPSVIKLADFGTSTIHSSQFIGDPINVQHVSAFSF
jgi:serine/threonine protein kinase